MVSRCCKMELLVHEISSGYAYYECIKCGHSCNPAAWSTHDITSRTILEVEKKLDQ